MKAKKTKVGLFWIDLETTGLNPTLDDILEVAWCVTDLSGNKVQDVQKEVLQVHRSEALVKADDEVIEMHYASGLLPQCFREKVSAEDAFKKLLDVFYLIPDDVKSHKFDVLHYAGSSVWFDRDFVNEVLRKDKHLREEMWPTMHHRLLDVSALCVGWPGVLDNVPESRHRAESDLARSLSIYQVFRGFVGDWEAAS